MHGQTFSMEDSPCKVVTPAKFIDDETIQSMKIESEKPSSNGMIKISLAHPSVISPPIKANGKYNSKIELDNAIWRTLTEQENTCRRCITRAAKSQFGQKRARKSSLNYIFPCDVGMKAFLRKVRSLLQHKITSYVSKLYNVDE